MFWIILAAVVVAGFFALYLFMTAGRPTDSWLADFDYAHRGLHSQEAPENSLAAFRRAMQNGYAIELDVHRSKDGRIMVFHDDDLERMTGTRGKIEDMTAEELRALRLNKSGERIPFLEEVLELVNGKTPLLIELKNTGRAGMLEVVVYKQMKDYHGKYAVQSFSPFSIRWFYKHAPEILRGQLSATFTEGAEAIPLWQRWGLRHLLSNVLCRPNFINYEKQGLRETILKRLRKNGLPVFAWTIRTEYEAKQALFFADALVFENFEPEEEKRA